MKTKQPKTARRPDRAQRRLIYMSAAQLKAIAAAARKLDTTQAALFRRALDLVIADSAKRAAK